ncbi:P-loop ATPase, Sll1717 family [Gimesia chilikensis]|uniref:Uncharacterized protein n=1 Tax=Gimesia chilikensis TaxID=2605989 RepID=A0A517PM72_9PLAN|nr:hypothetical protein [Gimesia chilikensis]QDT20463.1 hypothetical protein HG66A1_22490 [Gimesia chilikensis]
MTIQQPFGEECCEAEVKVFRESYQNLYFLKTPFNELALQSRNYLFIGRRGSGKTSLAHYFTFQNSLPSAKCIDVDEPKVYEKVLTKIAERASTMPDLAMSRVVAIWDFLIWSLIFDELCEEDPVINSARKLTTPDKASSLIRDLLKQLLSKFLCDDGELSDDLEEFLVSGPFSEAKNRAVKITNRKPVIIAIDSLEKYSIENQPMMCAIAALVESASNFNRSYAHVGIHVKVFISAEVFPHLEESEISNPSKYIRHPVYLHWRPKDLMRLVSWRLNEFFRRDPKFNSYCRDDVDWDSPGEVLEKVWNPHFGTHFFNGLDLCEATFPYVLRHTQLRPRQFVILCNHIADKAIKSEEFPRFSNVAILESIRKQEIRLAGELLNSYSKVFPNVANIVSALERFPMVFDAKKLDRMSSSTASQWPSGDYSPYQFRRLVAELGIVGRIRSWDNESKIITADFEYALEDRLTLTSKDKCVIHPMFFEKLSIEKSHKMIIYPFPNHPDFKQIMESMKND